MSRAPDVAAARGPEGETAPARSARRQQALPTALDPYLTFLLFAAIALGTWRVERHGRMTLLWLVLLAFILIRSATTPLSLGYHPRAFLRGLLAGLLLGIPALILGQKYLYAFANQLFAPDRGLTTGSQILILFQRVVLIAPFLEEAYFRGILQEEKGLLSASLAFGAGWFLYFAPGSQIPLLGLAIVFAAASLLGGYLGLVYDRYGLTAAIAAHASALLLLTVLPPTLQELLKAVS